MEEIRLRFELNRDASDSSRPSLALRNCQLEMDVPLALLLLLSSLLYVYVFFFVKEDSVYA